MTFRKPEIINSDQGGHFTNPEYILLLEEAGVKISMDGKGQCLDNARTERFFRTPKFDRIYINEYETPRELRIKYMKTIPIGHTPPWAECALPNVTSETCPTRLFHTKKHRREHNLVFSILCLDVGEHYSTSSM